MTYKQGCKYAALLGIPCLIFDVIVRIPPLYQRPERTLAGRWCWLTGGVIERTLEYKLLLPLLIIGFNVLAWGAVIWSVGNVVESSRPND